MNTEQYNCGHPRTPENTATHKRPTIKAGVSYRCRICTTAASKKAKALYNARAKGLAPPGRKRNNPIPTANYPAPGAWTERALCAYTPNPELWFEKDKLAQNRARNRCFDCPVMFECETYATTNRIPYGVWGGLTARERGFTNEGQPRQRG